jgi:hypothetical protein
MSSTKENKMRSVKKCLKNLIFVAASTSLALAALPSLAQSPSEQAAVVGRVISSTPLVQPNQNQPTAYNVVYEYAGKQYTVQMPRDPGNFVQLQVTPVGVQQYPQQYDQNANIPAPVIQPQTVYVPPVQQVVYAPQPVVYQQPYYANTYVNPYIYPAIGIGLGYAAYRGGYFGGHRGFVGHAGGRGGRR